MHLLNFWRNGNFGIDELLEGGQLSAVEAKAHCSYLD
jgi:hypothetical protein